MQPPAAETPTVSRSRSHTTEFVQGSSSEPARADSPGASDIQNAYQKLVEVVSTLTSQPRPSSNIPTAVIDAVQSASLHSSKSFASAQRAHFAAQQAFDAARESLVLSESSLKSAEESKNYCNIAYKAVEDLSWSSSQSASGLKDEKLSVILAQIHNLGKLLNDQDSSRKRRARQPSPDNTQPRPVQSHFADGEPAAKRRRIGAESENLMRHVEAEAAAAQQAFLSNTPVTSSSVTNGDPLVIGNTGHVQKDPEEAQIEREEAELRKRREQLLARKTGESTSSQASTPLNAPALAPKRIPQLSQTLAGSEGPMVANTGADPVRTPLASVNGWTEKLQATTDVPKPNSLRMTEPQRNQSAEMQEQSLRMALEKRKQLEEQAGRLRKKSSPPQGLDAANKETSNSSQSGPSSQANVGTGGQAPSDAAQTRRSSSIPPIVHFTEPSTHGAPQSASSIEYQPLSVVKPTSSSARSNSQKLMTAMNLRHLRDAHSERTLPPTLPQVSQSPSVEVKAEPEEFSFFAAQRLVNATRQANSTVSDTPQPQPPVITATIPMEEQQLAGSYPNSAIAMHPNMPKTTPTGPASRPGQSLAGQSLNNGGTLSKSARKKQQQALRQVANQAAQVPPSSVNFPHLPAKPASQLPTSGPGWGAAALAPSSAGVTPNIQQQQIQTQTQTQMQAQNNQPQPQPDVIHVTPTSKKVQQLPPIRTTTSDTPRFVASTSTPNNPVSVLTPAHAGQQQQQQWSLDRSGETIPGVSPSQPASATQDPRKPVVPLPRRTPTKPQSAAGTSQTQLRLQTSPTRRASQPSLSSEVASRQAAGWKQLPPIESASLAPTAPAAMQASKRDQVAPAPQESIQSTVSTQKPVPAPSTGVNRVEIPTGPNYGLHLQSQRQQPGPSHPPAARGRSPPRRVSSRSPRRAAGRSLTDRMTSPDRRASVADHWSPTPGRPERNERGRSYSRSRSPYTSSPRSWSDRSRSRSRSPYRPSSYSYSSDMEISRAVTPPRRDEYYDYTRARQGHNLVARMEAPRGADTYRPDDTGPRGGGGNGRSRSLLGRMHQQQRQQPRQQQNGRRNGRGGRGGGGSGGGGLVQRIDMARTPSPPPARSLANRLR